MYRSTGSKYTQHVVTVYLLRTICSPEPHSDTIAEDPSNRGQSQSLRTHAFVLDNEEETIGQDG